MKNMNSQRITSHLLSRREERIQEDRGSMARILLNGKSGEPSEKGFNREHGFSLPQLLSSTKAAIDLDECHCVLVLDTVCVCGH